MKTKQFKAGEILHRAGESADTLELIVKGIVSINVNNYDLKLKKGSVLGILETAGTPYSYDYVATEDTIVTIYPYTRFSDVHSIVEDNFKTADVLVTAFAGTLVSLSSQYRKLSKSASNAYRTIERFYAKYKELCVMHKFEVQALPFLDNSAPFVPEKDMPEWVSDYYDQLEIMPRDAKQSYFGTHFSLATAAIWEAGSHAALYISLCTQLSHYIDETFSLYFNSPSGDLLDLYINLMTKAKNAGAKDDIFIEIDEAVNDIFEFFSRQPIPENILDKKHEMYDAAKASVDTTKEDIASVNEYECINDSLDTILKYASLDDAEEERFRQLISSYKMTQDKNSADDSIRQLRLDIAKSFFDIYEAAIVSAFESESVPIILKMFFYFGYMDESLIGRDNALKLYKIACDLENDSSDTIMTAYSWLRMIYHGEAEPSKNEFDQDYPSYLKSQRAGGYISADMEERYLSSNKEKLRFEMRNFFKTNLKISSGRPSTFCPVLSDSNILKPLETILVTRKQINENWDYIKSIDYSCFYRECSFQAPEYNITRDSIILEVMPTVILMPGIGSRATLWQETSGVRRDTPGRISIPIFSNEELLNMQIKLAGEFRWEICKKIQGSRWNDVTDHSLTSDYFDYLQFYRKNNELSAEAKEKVKSAITNAKNSFKSVFIQDYMLWIKYEYQGSPRLNKYAKNIMFTYCPFAKEHREKLKNNPMYSDMISRHELKAQRKVKPLATRYSKIAMSGEGKGLPIEIKNYLKFFEL